MGEEPKNETVGVLYALAAYTLWGLLPLYWRLLDDVAPFEVAMHRIFWCALLVGGITLMRKRVARIRGVLRRRRLVLALTLSSLLIAVNWTTYIYSVALHDVVEASLGYFINPLLSILLGVFLLGEKISGVRIAAVVLASLALVVKAVLLGHVPVIALVLALTFALYGYVRKLVPVDPLDGLFIESALLVPIALIVLAALGMPQPFELEQIPTRGVILLIVSGAVTALPLTLFAAGARRIRLSTLGFVQYISPILTLVVAIQLFHESFTAVDGFTFGCIWLALLLVVFEKPLQRWWPSVRAGN